MTNLIPDVSLEDNSSQRLACVLLVDGSTSMEGPPIDALNAGLRLLEAELKEDSTARLRVRLLVLRIGGSDQVDVVTNWTDAMHFTAPTIIANGNTPLGKGVRRALLEIEDEKGRYDAAGIPFNRPWLYIMTDGEPTENDWMQAAAECKAAEASNKVVVFGVGVENADLTKLGEFSSRPPMLLDGLKFHEFFFWLSRSTASGSKSAIGAPVQLPSVESWAVIKN